LTVAAASASTPREPATAGFCRSLERIFAPRWVARSELRERQIVGAPAALKGKVKVPSDPPPGEHAEHTSSGGARLIRPLAMNFSAPSRSHTDRPERVTPASGGAVLHRARIPNRRIVLSRTRSTAAHGRPLAPDDFTPNTQHQTTSCRSRRRPTTSYHRRHRVRGRAKKLASTADGSGCIRDDRHYLALNSRRPRSRTQKAPPT